MASQQGNFVPEAVGPKVRKHAMSRNGCILFFEDTDSVIACSKTIMPSSRVGARITCKTGGYMEPYIGFTLDLPFPSDQSANEDSGHGVSFSFHQSRTVQPNEHVLTVKFPRETLYTYEVASQDFINRFWAETTPPVEGDVAILRAQLPAGETARVMGYGVPFANPDNRLAEAWYSRGQPDPDAHLLLDFLEQKMFKFAIGSQQVKVQERFGPDNLHETAYNPYLRDLVTDMDEFRAMAKAHRGPAMAPIFWHDEYRTHLCAAQQGTVQDVLWLEDAAKQLYKQRSDVRFANPGQGRIYAISFKIAIFESPEDENPAHVLNCRVVTRAFVFDVGIREVTRQALTVNIFHPDARPTNDYASTASAETTETEVNSWMLLHRCLVQGAGFFEWTKVTRQVSMPTVNLLDFGDSFLADAIVQEALPLDQARFRGYLSNRPLGCGLLIAAPGTGKTTASAAAVLAMNVKFGQILCSGPTNRPSTITHRKSTR
ncbi:hypothetical protein LMH87_006878 [Akanthomyces muscarius]|uniref:Uncharacterized protein n=1 Tax=Akanthomyces muscarius TaxID=2231603 RepID=A0A9W8QPM2_AKAMU|nr:hypothetical protein LMH87_006878 [Akanthomyces muscarius]KAJ4165238.1 hypothetical protein LMH87_006878 [Akanthomyces muscarius]